MTAVLVLLILPPPKYSSVRTDVIISSGLQQSSKVAALLEQLQGELALFSKPQTDDGLLGHLVCMHACS